MAFIQCAIMSRWQVIFQEGNLFRKSQTERYVSFEIVGSKKKSGDVKHSPLLTYL